VTHPTRTVCRSVTEAPGWSTMWTGRGRRAAAVVVATVLVGVLWTSSAGAEASTQLWAEFRQASDAHAAAAASLAELQSRAQGLDAGLATTQRDLDATREEVQRLAVGRYVSDYQFETTLLSSNLSSKL